MASDSSIYSQIAPVAPPPNLLAQQGQIAQTAGSILGVRNLLARQAAGQAFQASINPDGTTNQTALLKNLAADPNAAMAAQESGQAGQTLAGAELNQRAQRLGYGANATAQLLTQYPNGVPLDAAKAVYDRSVQDGIMTPADEAGVMQGLSNDPIANANVIKQRLLQHVGALSALTASVATPGLQDVGPGLQGTTTTPLAGPNPPTIQPNGTFIQKSTGPETNAALVETYVPDPNNPGSFLRVMKPRSALAGASGVTGPVQPPAGHIPGNGSYRPSQAAPAPSGLQPAPAQPPAPMPASVPPAAAPQASVDQPILAAPPQGQQAGLDADVAAYKAAQQTVPAAQQSVQQLQTAQQALELAHSGRSTETTHNMYSFLKAQGVLPAGMQDNVTNYDIARKAMLSYAQTTAGSSGTNLGLDTALHSNASMDIDHDAAMHVLKQNLGLKRQQIAQVLEAPNPSGAGYGQHVSTFTGATDPRAFAWDSYTPQERLAITTDASKTQGGLEKLDNSLMIAARRGLIRLPSAAPAQAAPAAPPDASRGY